jgi:hypothetical protein
MAAEDRSRGWRARMGCPCPSRVAAMIGSAALQRTVTNRAARYNTLCRIALRFFYNAIND